MNDLKKKIKEKISELGFDVIGFTEPTIDKKAKAEYREYLEKNHHGQMKWLENHFEKKTNPKKVWDKVETVIVLGLNYTPETNPIEKIRNKEVANISVYANNKDYHKITNAKLQQIKDWLLEKYQIDSKYFVDSSPIFEKYFAQKTKIGWLGKHTNIVSKKYGSWLFLSEIFLPVSINITEEKIDNCGSCKSCVDICPTNAIVSNYKIDSRKCISYLTIEHRGPIPKSLRKKIGNRVYGCDDCLSVCPWNKFTTTTNKEEFIPKENEKNLSFFLDFNKQKFNDYFVDSPIKRIGWLRFLRNVIISSGNSESKFLAQKLKKYLSHPDAIIRGAAVWSISQFSSKKKIEKFLQNEKNKYVLYELNSLD